MKLIFYPLGILCILLCFTLQKANAQANTSLSNLAATSINQDLLPGTDNSNNLGSLVKGWKQLYLDNSVFIGGSKFISFGNTMSLGITAVGNNALSANTGGFANTGIGFYSLAVNTNGNANSAIGTRSLQANTTGSGNMAMGYFSLYSNKTGYSNVAIGVRSMLSCLSGHNQIAIGDSALFTTNGGDGFNTAIGSKALYSNLTGSYNTANGSYSLFLNTTGTLNTAIGYTSLYNNTTGDNNTATGDGSLYANTVGSNNTAVGHQSLKLNVDGTDNTAVGYASLIANYGGLGNTAIGSNSLFSNGSGNYNTATGYLALTSNYNSSYNTATGFWALNSNLSGEENTAIGALSLQNNISGNSNAAVGRASLLANTYGDANSGFGYGALENNTSGNYNVAVGTLALNANITGFYNTAVGFQANVSSSDLSNMTAIGAGAVATASNQLMLGNTDIVAVMATANYTMFSDGRYKKDIQPNVPGLEFIKELRPVTYHYNIHGINDHIQSAKPSIQTGKNDAGYKSSSVMEAFEEASITAKEKKLYTGFVAQEVETAAKKFNYDFSGLYKPQSEKDLYGLSYSDFVVPLVKAVQELNDSLQEEREKNTAKIDSLEARLQRIEELLKGVSNMSSSFSDGSSLAQNAPNPFHGNTSISYSLPSGFTHAEILISDMSGKLIQTINVSGSGRGVLSVDAGSLASGVYSYALYADSKMIGAKQMVVVK